MQTTLSQFHCPTTMLVALIICLASFNASAFGPLAGEKLINTAEVNYKISNTPQSTVTAQNELTVDAQLNLHVASIAPSAIASFAGQKNAAVGFKVTNLSNSINDVLLAVRLASEDNAGSPDTYTSSTGNLNTVAPNGSSGLTINDHRLFVDVNGNGIYEPGIDTAQVIDNLGPGESRTVFVVTDIPTDVPEGKLAAVALIAQIADTEGNAITNDDSGNTSPAGTFANGISTPAGTAININKADSPNSTLKLFADGNSPINSDGSKDDGNDGQHSATNGYLFKLSPALLEKSAKIIDCNSKKEVLEVSSSGEVYKGACVRYTLTVKVIVDAVTAIKVNDAIPSGTSYVANSLTLDGTSITDDSDGDKGHYANAQVEFDLGTLNKDTTQSIEFIVKVQ
ncbi:MAG: hypothetical protein AAGF06_06240 [Pseudomonadota bacterium]